jgi:hypothetical protein
MIWRQSALEFYYDLDAASACLFDAGINPFGSEQAVNPVIQGLKVARSR